MFVFFTAFSRPVSFCITLNVEVVEVSTPEESARRVEQGNINFQGSTKVR